MSEQSGSRIGEARRRAATAKRRLAAVAGAAFVVVLGLAYASHPGNASSAASADVRDGDTLLGQEDAFDFGYYGSIAPSGSSAPQVRSSAS